MKLLFIRAVLLIDNLLCTTVHISRKSNIWSYAHNKLMSQNEQTFSGRKLTKMQPKLKEWQRLKPLASYL